MAAAKHGADSGIDEAGASVAELHGEALLAIKRELGAIIVFGALFAFAVIHWFDGLEEAVLLGGYGVGAALWIRIRAGGLLLSLRRHRRGGGHGAQQE